MNDEELRSHFDLMVNQVPVRGDAGTLVRSRVSRIRRRRSSAAVAGLVVAVGIAVAVPETLQHQAKSAGSSLGSGLTTTCDPAAVRAAAQYGSVERMYGTVTTASALTAWLGQVGGIGPAGALPAATPVPLCLLIGRLDGPAGGVDGHYVLLSVVDGVAELVYKGPDLPSFGAMPGVARSQIKAWSGPAATHGPAAPTTGAAALLTPALPPSPGASSANAIMVPACTSQNVSGVLRGVGFPDGIVQGGIEITNESATACSLHGDLQMAVLTTTGAALAVPPGGLPGPTKGVYAPMPVKAVLQPVAIAQSLAPVDVGRLLQVIVGNDAGGACAAKDRQTRPASFRLTIGKVTVTVANLDAAASDTHKQSIVGCPGRFYAGSATLQ